MDRESMVSVSNTDLNKGGRQGKDRESMVSVSSINLNSAPRKSDQGGREARIGNLWLVCLTPILTREGDRARIGNLWSVCLVSILTQHPGRVTREGGRQGQGIYGQCVYSINLNSALRKSDQGDKRQGKGRESMLVPILALLLVGNNEAKCCGVRSNQGY